MLGSEKFRATVREYTAGTTVNPHPGYSEPLPALFVGTRLFGSNGSAGNSTAIDVAVLEEFLLSPTFIFYNGT